MERIKKILEKLCMFMVLMALIISDSSFADIKVAKASTYYQYLIQIEKPHTIQGDLKNVVEGTTRNVSFVKRTDTNSYMQIDISNTSDVSTVYKAIVEKIDTSTLVRNGYHMRVMVGVGSSVSDTPKSSTLALAKSMIAGDPNNHRSLYIYWDCDHLTDASKWKLTAGATCQHANQYTCSVCGATKSEGSKIAHNYSVKLASATCQHLDVYKCATCSDTRFSGNYAEHDWAEKKAATCTERRVLYCKTCGTTKEDGEVTSHQYSTRNIVAPTTSSKGYTRYTCSCGAYYDDTFTYKIEYDANGGSGNMGGQILNYDSNEVLKSNSFTREGYNFTGWNTKENGRGVNYKNGQIVKNISTSTIKLYAQWAKNKFKVTCVDCYENGEIIDSINNNRTIEVDSGEMVSGENFGTDTGLGAYYPGMMYVSSDAPVKVSDNITVKRYFKSFKENGLGNAVISGDTLVKVSGNSEKIVIPDEIKKIGNSAFSDNKDIISVEIKNGTVTQIEECAFENCSSLKKIVLPYSVKKIGKNAFKGCTSLETIEIKNPECEIDDSYETIPERTEINGFSYSSAQTYSNKNHREFNSVKVLYDNFFSGETYIQSFQIPDDVAVIEDNAFKNCENLRKIKLGNVISIGRSAFEGCISLEYEKDFSKEQLKALMIPASVKKIGKNAFAGAKKIEQIKFEGKETVIEDKTAINADTLIGCYAGSMQYDFANENKFKMVLIIGFSADTENAGGIDYKNNSEIVAAIIGNNVNEIDKFAFAGCSNLEYVKLHNDEIIKNEIVIGDSAFFNCSSLNRIEFNDNVEISRIEDNAFFGCKKLKEIVINNPNCIISDKKETIDNETIIKSWSRSSASDYCEKNNKKFEQIGISFVVTFDKDGGEGGTEKIYVYPHINMSSISVPKKTGYAFMGYYLEDKQYYNNSGHFVLGEELNIENDMVVKAVWDTEKYSIEFDANGAQGHMNILEDIEYDKEVSAPECEFIRKGYHFTGWSISENNKTDIYKAGDKLKNLAQNSGQIVKLYAQWEENNYKIEYNLNGGTGKIPESISVLYNSDYVIADNTGTKEYYLFNGWNTRYDGKGENYIVGQNVKQISAQQDETITLYAQWKPVLYNINLNLNGGELAGYTNPLQYSCETEDFEIAEPKKHGYNFTGWSEEGHNINKNIVVKKGSHGDIKLNANYELAQYDVKFETNGGKFKDNSSIIKSYKFGDNINLPIDVIKQNYIFKGWSTIKNSGKTDVSKITSSDTGNKVFYAVWGAASYNITYVMNGGSIAAGENASAYLYGTGIKLPENVTRNGYSFAGWYLDEKCTGKMITKVSDTDTGDKKFFAKWIPDGKNNQVVSTPEASVKPGASSNPLQSTKPSESTKPLQSAKPSESIKPLQSVKPSESSAPLKSAEPSESKAPANSENTSESNKPGEDNKPSEDEKTTNSNEPLQSSKPEETTKPSIETTPSRPHQSQGAGKNSNNTDNNNDRNNNKIFRYCNYNKNKKTVKLKNVCNKNIKKANIPDTIKYKGVTYKVTMIAPDAFKNCKQLKEVTIGKNIISIGKNCFKNCAKMKNMKIKANNLRKVGKNAIKKTNKKLRIKCKKKNIKKYKKIFKNKGNKTYVVKSI